MPDAIIMPTPAPAHENKAPALSTFAPRRILCATDFSQASAEALSFALAVARSHGSAVTVLHVFKPEHLTVRKETAVRSEEEDAWRNLREAIAERGGAGGPNTVTPVVESGDPASRILEIASSTGADLVVVGTHARHGIDRLVLGSIAEKVLRHAPCTVITVPPRAAGGTGRFHHILCATDFSAASRAAFAAACALADSSHAALTLVHVVEWPWPEPPAPVLAELPGEQAAALADFRAKVTDDASEKLTAILGERLNARVQITARVMHGKPASQILHAASDVDADLIVLGVRSRSAADLFFLGSTANQLLHTAHCPVVTVRA